LDCVEQVKDMRKAIWHHTKASLLRGLVFIALIPTLLVPIAPARAETSDDAYFTYRKGPYGELSQPVFLVKHTQSIQVGYSLPEEAEGLLISEDVRYKYPISSSNRPFEPDNLSSDIINYNAQTGDTLPSLAARFQTTPENIMEANPSIKKNITTLQPGQLIHIPAKMSSLTESIFQILPDSAFVNGPAQTDFDIDAFIKSQPGWLKKYVGYDGSTNQTAAYIVGVAARDYHISPKLLLALLDYQSGALTKPEATVGDTEYPLGYANPRYKHLYNQVMLVSNWLNDGYYTWRVGDLIPFENETSQKINPDPRQNAATIAIQRFFYRLKTASAYQDAVNEEGFWATYKRLFGDPWLEGKTHIAENLQQPQLGLPFAPSKVWAFTGGPHTGWGDSGQPLAALDFAPPSLAFGCIVSAEWATAVADGVIARSENGTVYLDLDGDGDERTGWVIQYFHLATKDRVAAGKTVKRGDYIGHPSCEGGHATGSHIHIARLFNGEWIIAYGPVAFNLEGWIAHKGDAIYQGTLTRQTQIVYANTNANDKTLIMSDAQLASTGQFFTTKP
jgi:LasA protease